MVFIYILEGVSPAGSPGKDQGGQENQYPNSFTSLNTSNKRKVLKHFIGLVYLIYIALCVLWFYFLHRQQNQYCLVKSALKKDDIWVRNIKMARIIVIIIIQESDGGNAIIHLK